MTKKNHQDIFNKFAGKEVNVVEWQDYPVGGPRPHEKVTYRTLDYEDPVILAFEKAAADEGLILRLWLPNTEGALMFREDRDTYLVGYVDKAEDGKWRIAPKFRVQ
ncbi:MAG: hypothetical protein EPN97_18515 [Alphaproteobacteria bacterium]|nr:MAG: hypothetical protein EPN97_18515 [Alphaproteobacteria bacterium]